MLNIFYPPTSVDIKWRHLSSSFDSQLLKAEENIELKCVAKVRHKIIDIYSLKNASCN